MHVHRLSTLKPAFVRSEATRQNPYSGIRQLIEELDHMTTLTTATVVKGMLKPDASIPLPDQTRVNLTIEPIEERSHPAQAWASLKAWIRANPLHGLGPRLTRDELHERR
jgi:hypothetical protein